MPRIPVVDQDECISCEVCVSICPEVFRMQGEGDDHHHHKSFVYNPTGAPEEKIEQAMDNCPAACIHWQD
ncbi:ferredoxin [Desulfuromonas sp. AOP6]|uniref:ferredoxin n=1 Tax=Desulfuromonas sp. AOP6 TaxID=1566351 RepID=UPI001282C4BE|nr:ferredoxin [Desulfuromonas sp. AOP6]BCA80240.1 ferredoxin [Desulfuromonas sp. AOP6]